MCRLLFIIIIILGYTLVLGIEEAFASSYDNTSQDWDRLLIEEVPTVRDSVNTIQNAVNEGNYSLIMEQIDDIESGDSWYNIQKELEARGAVNLISQFRTSLTELDTMARAEDSIAITKQTQKLSDDLYDIVGEVSEPVVDIQRLILMTSIIGIVIGSGLYIIPKFRRKFNIKY